jgi:putative hydrolase of the HAD superfamily
MVRPKTCLVDVFDTIVTCDFAALGRGLATIAGVPAGAWARAITPLLPLLTDGRISMAGAIEQVLRACGAEPQAGLVTRLVHADRELLLRSARLHDDAIPFLEMLRSRGILIALVSNCAEHTRELLDSVGVSMLTDSVVLSCEVGWAKPSARIYQHALDRLGVPADAAVFVDDQPAYCAGAVAVGMNAVRIVRGPDEAANSAAGVGRVGGAGAGGVGVAAVGSLLQIEAML